MYGFKYVFPEIFKRIHNGTTTKAIQLEKLRQSKITRYSKEVLVVQGFQVIKQLRDLGFNFRSIIATAKKTPRESEEVGYPAKQVIENTDAFPADDYYLADIDLTRKILGTASKPGIHEVFAEIDFPRYELDSGDRWVVFDKVNDGESLGTLVTIAQGLGWDSGIVTSNSSDLYNDAAVRASGARTLTWPHRMIDFGYLKDFLKKHNMTPVVAEVMSKRVKDAWSPEFGCADVNDIKPDSGLWFWNRNGKEEIPKKIALVISCNYEGINKTLHNAMRVSIPLAPKVNSLHVTAAGSIIMAELSKQRVAAAKKSNN